MIIGPPPKFHGTRDNLACFLAGRIDGVIDELSLP